MHSGQGGVVRTWEDDGIAAVAVDGELRGEDVDGAGADLNLTLDTQRGGHSRAGEDDLGGGQGHLQKGEPRDTQVRTKDHPEAVEHHIVEAVFGRRRGSRRLGGGCGGSAAAPAALVCVERVQRAQQLRAAAWRRAGRGGPAAAARLRRRCRSGRGKRARRDNGAARDAEVPRDRGRRRAATRGDVRIHKAQKCGVLHLDRLRSKVQPRPRVLHRHMHTRHAIALLYRTLAPALSAQTPARHDTHPPRSTRRERQAAPRRQLAVSRGCLEVLHLEHVPLHH